MQMTIAVMSDIHGKAQYLILHGTGRGWEEEFVSLDYDTETIIGRLHASGLDQKAPFWCRVTEEVLRTGKLSHSMVLSRAMELCRKDTGSCIWPDIPEIYWEQAVNEMICCEHKQEA